MKKKHLITVCLSTLLTHTLHPLMAGNTITYTSSNGKVVTPATKSFGANIVSNVYYDDYGVIFFDDEVTHIGDYAFLYCGSLTSIEIPESVTSIGSMAFVRCTSLSSIEIPSSVTSIGEEAFYDCSSLASVEIPESVTYISYNAFSGTPWINSYITDVNNHFGNIVYINKIAYQAISKDIQNCEFKQGTISIAENAFYDCTSLTSIEIPESVTFIGHWAFYGTSEVTSLYFGAQMDINSSITGSMIKLKEVILGDGVTGIGDKAFQNYSSLTTIKIPSSVTNIGDDAFNGCCSLTSVELSSGVTNIGEKAFSECPFMTSIEIPSSVTSIGNNAFAGCYFTKENFVNKSSLTDSNNWGANIVDQITEDGLIIDRNVVIGYRGNPTSVIVPEGVTSIGNVFYKCSSLTSIVLPSSVTSIGNQAFYECSSLTYVEIPASVTSIGEEAFKNCRSLTSIELPSSITSIDDGAFAYSGLVSIEIPSGVTTIGEGVFSGCGLTSIEIPEGVTSIDDWAFYRCENLTSIELSASVTSIGQSAFEYCCSLKSIKIPSNSNLTSIGNHAFGWSGLPSIELPTSVTSIGDCAFYASLTSIKIPSNSNMTSIDGGAFLSCLLTSIEIPSNVTSIGEGAFRECESLTSIKFLSNSNLTSIGDRAFTDCRSLTSIEIPSSVTSIGEEAFSCSDYYLMFYGHLLLSAIYVGDIPPTIAPSTFSGVDKNSCILYVPAGCAEAYRNAPYWSEFISIQEVDPKQYDDVLYIDNLQAFVGEDVTLSLQLKNAKDLTGFQAKVYLPEGVSFVNDELGFADAYLSETRAKGINLDTQEQSDGSLLLLAYSTKNIKFVGNEGEVATVTIHLDAGMEDGEYPILLKEIVLTDADGQTIEIDCVKSTMTVESYTLGDANGDHKVNVGDIAATASYILGNNPPNFVFKGADANGDTKINVGDLAKIASMILGTDQSKAPRRAAEEEMTSFEMNMLLEPMNDGNYQLHVGIDNIGPPFSGFQFDLCLPEGLKVKADADGFAEAALSTERTNARQTDLFDCAFVEDGQLRVLCASTRNALFAGESGEVATIMLEADADFEAQGLIALRNIAYTSIGESNEAADVVMEVANAISSIELIEDDSVVTIYDMQGRVVKRGSHDSHSIESLHQGVYVINGKKVIL